MRRLLIIAILALFFSWVLWLHPLHVEAETISLKLLPTLERSNMELDLVLLIVAVSSLLISGSIFVLERFDLAIQNKKLKKQVTQLQEEVNSLRNILTTDQEVE